MLASASILSFYDKIFFVLNLGSHNFLYICGAPYVFGWQDTLLAWRNQYAMTFTRASAWFQKPINTNSMVCSDRNISFAKVRWKVLKNKLEQRFKVSGKLQVRKYIYSLRINTHIRNKILFKCYWNSSNFWKSLMKFLVDIKMLWFL